MTISGVLGEGFRIYRRLWRRSIVVAGVVFVIISFATAAAAKSGTALAGAVALLLSWVGGLLVQGSLVEVVRDLHEGRPPASASEYYDRTRGRLGTLLGTSILYGLGLVVAFICLIVPFFIALARWSLVVPLVMIERLGVREAFSRSSQLVKGKSGRVLGLLVVTGIIGGFAQIIVRTILGGSSSFWTTWISGAVAGAIVIPWEAHVLTALYYTLKEPDVPVLPESPPRKTWESIWDEERE
jgi:hypothetical protein